LEGIDSSVKKLFEQRERDFLLSHVRITMRRSVENIDVGEFSLERAKEGEIIELPRWVAEEFAHLNLGEMEEEPFENEIFKAIAREKMMGAPQLSTLQPDFYIRMKRKLVMIKQGVESGRFRREDYERLKSGCYDLIGRRLSKLLSLSSASTTLDMISDKLTPEEKVFFSTAQSLSKEWKEALLGEGM
jgi:hypothetical protein